METHVSAEGSPTRSREGKRWEGPMAKLFCETCKKDANFLPIHMITKIAGVSRSTIYYWLDHGWVHCLTLPSGRRVICEASLSRPVNPPSDVAPNASPPKKPSKPVDSPRNL